VEPNFLWGKECVKNGKKNGQRETKRIQGTNITRSTREKSVIRGLARPGDFLRGGSETIRPSEMAAKAGGRGRTLNTIPAGVREDQKMKGTRTKRAPGGGEDTDSDSGKLKSKRGGGPGFLRRQKSMEKGGKSKRWKDQWTGLAPHEIVWTPGKCDPQKGQPHIILTAKQENQALGWT